MLFATDWLGGTTDMNKVKSTSSVAAASDAGQPLISIRDLNTKFLRGSNTIHAVNGVSLDIFPGEVVGLVGESGSGKSVTALSVLKLLPRSVHWRVEGEILFDGQDLTALDPRQIRAIRGSDIAMVFQEPMSSLNPLMRLGDQICESLILHRNLGRRAARLRATELLDMVRIADPARRMREYPHQLSGGMRQRAMIAIALACAPKLLIADEPTTALDVTIQAQVLQLMMGMNKQTGTAMLLITHDLGVIAETADRVAVMYAGRIVEEATVDELFERPLHPYTRGLMAAAPRSRRGLNGAREPLLEIPGSIPSLLQPIQGCAFAPRCGFASDACHVQAPPMQSVAGNHKVACFATQKTQDLGAVL